MPNATWPEGTLARYLTVGGATVDISPKPEVDVDAMQSHCHGCDGTEEHNRWYGIDRNAEDARKWVQSHAEACRALPRPTES